MKKRVTVISFVLLLVIVILGNLWYRNSFIAELHKDMKQEEMLASSIGFSLDEMTKVTIKIKSVIKNGDVNITLQDKNGEIVHQFKTDCKEKEVLNLEAGIYKIRLDSESCKGKFDITVRKNMD